MQEKIFFQIKEHFLLYLSIIAFVISVFLFISNKDLSRQIARLQEDRDAAQTQIATLFLSMEDRDRMALLDRELLKVPGIETKLSEEIPPFSKRLLDLHKKYEAEGLKASIILGVIEVESAFTHDAVGYATDTNQPLSYGLMQLTAPTAKMLLGPRGLTWSKEILFNPVLNVELGTELLHVIHSSYVERGLEKIDQFNLTLATYNAGEKTVLDYYFNNGNRLPEFSRTYVAKVNLARKRWSMLGF